MKKGLYILSLIAFLVVFSACEKCSKPVMTEDPFAITENRSSSDKEDGDFSNDNQKGGEDADLNGGTDGGITDPDKDDDFDGIVDPDEDEDFDKDGK